MRWNGATTCLIPATHYYEWETATGEKVKYAIEPKNYDGFYLARIYRIEAGKPVFTILTSAAAEGTSFIHDRMTVILPSEATTEWWNPRYHGNDILMAALTEMEYMAC